MPKNLKTKEQEIQKQFKDAVKTQHKQHKLLKQQVLLKTNKVDVERKWMEGWREIE